MKKTAVSPALRTFMRCHCQTAGEFRQRNRLTSLLRQQAFELFLYTCPLALSLAHHGLRQKAGCGHILCCTQGRLKRNASAQQGAELILLVKLMEDVLQCTSSFLLEAKRRLMKAEAVQGRTRMWQSFSARHAPKPFTDTKFIIPGI